ncbi:hypothetical protein ACIRU3_29550 [Streptomyces sp. NPDC101151]|uniref:hypothetical protein n=1 Tax=Streptomyces sp. NPDC101151 TaxID=3366115 RepID=UPI003816C789
MEILLLCAIAFAAGQRSEQASLGISPADRAMAKEYRRHEQAVHRIAEKHGAPPPAPAPLPGASPWKESAPAPAGAAAVPGTFRSGYRSYAPMPRTATLTGRRAGAAGAWAARGVAWARDTGRGALHEYRRRREADGHEDPAPVLAALPPTHPPAVPPMPTEPPTVGDKTDEAPAARSTPEADKAPESAGEELPDGEDWASVYAWTDEDEPEPAEPEKTPEEAPERSGPAPSGEAGPSPEPAAQTEAPAAPGSGTTSDRKGVGRMAAEVTYDSVMEESDELSLMCDDDVKVYDRIGMRCEREIGRADALIADARNAGVGESVIGWIARALEKYQGIHSSLDELRDNTIAQGEAVVKAKELLRVGQGLYAGIAQDMEDVADREFYVSDAVDGEDTSAQSETYETRGA